MRTIKWSKDFKKDYRRIKATPRHAQNIDELLQTVAGLLAEDNPLLERFCDHALVGSWRGYRECHIKPNLLLIYRTAEPGVLRLVRLGSHSELF